MTISTLLNLATRRLAAAGIDTPRLEAQILLAHALTCRREDLVREPERVVEEASLAFETFEAFVMRRERREPLPYITGTKPFYGRTFAVSPAVLIPRPETEILVSATLARLRDVPRPKIVDVGCGSGCIAVTLAAERPDATLWATDISPDALAVAARNAQTLGVADRIHFLPGDLLDPIGEGGLDAVVSNPPYVAEYELNALQPEVRDFEPRLALTEGSGPMGDAIYPRLFAQAFPRLKPGGWVLVEVGFGQADRVMEMALGEGFESVESLPDYAGIPRVILARRP